MEARRVEMLKSDKDFLIKAHECQPQTSSGCWPAQWAPPAEWLQTDLVSSAPPEQDLQTPASSTWAASETRDESPGSWRRRGQKYVDTWTDFCLVCILELEFFTCTGCWAGWAAAEIPACWTTCGWEQSAGCQTGRGPPGSIESQTLTGGSQRVCYLEEFLLLFSYPWCCYHYRRCPYHHLCGPQYICALLSVHNPVRPLRSVTWSHGMVFKQHATLGHSMCHFTHFKFFLCHLNPSSFSRLRNVSSSQSCYPKVTTPST